MCPIVQTTFGHKFAVVLTALATAAMLIGCTSNGVPPDGSGGLVAQVLARSSDLAAALDTVPDVPGSYVMFTDWSMLGHRIPKDPDAEPFAADLLNDEGGLQRDLGIRSTSADWEIDMWRPQGPGTIVLHFGQHTALAGVASKLTRFGYRANGSVFTGTPDKRRLWTYSLRSVGIATDRQLLVAGPDATAVRSVLAGVGSPLGDADSVAPLLALAAAKLSRIATASLVVGKPACVTLEELLRGRGTPAMLALLRKRLKGTFTRPQAEIAALESPAATTGVDALTFADQRTAQVNKASRSAAAKMLNGGNPDGIRVAGSAVTGRVLSFALTARKPHDIVNVVLDGTLGVDLCR